MLSIFTTVSSEVSLSSPIIAKETADILNSIHRWGFLSLLLILLISYFTYQILLKVSKSSDKKNPWFIILEVICSISAIVAIVFLLVGSLMTYISETKAVIESNKNISVTVEEKYGIKTTENIFKEFTELSKPATIISEGILPNDERVPLTFTVTEDNLDVKVHFMGNEPAILDRAKD